MEYYFGPYAVDVQRVFIDMTGSPGPDGLPIFLPDIDGYEAFHVNVFPTGSDPRTGLRFGVLRPEGPVGPFRELVIAQDVLYDLWKASEDPAYIHRVLMSPVPPQGPGSVRDAYEAYIEQLRTSASRHYVRPLKEAVEASDNLNTRRLAAEDRTTDVSLHNAKVLLNRYGLPEVIRLHNVNEPPVENVVATQWGRLPEGSIAHYHEFSGFSWGYLGPAPHGFAEFLRMVGSVEERRTIAYVMSIDASELPRKSSSWRRGRKAWDPTRTKPKPLPVFKKGVDYGLER